eukprot:XP_001707269.1 Hypothetical protein GL50803_36743 [Giardia lamblia ATCC 50803]
MSGQSTFRIDSMRLFLTLNTSSILPNVFSLKTLARFCAN